MIKLRTIRFWSTMALIPFFVVFMFNNLTGIIGIATLQKEDPHMMDGKFISFDNMWTLSELTIPGLGMILLVVILTLVDTDKKQKIKEEKKT